MRRRNFFGTLTAGSLAGGVSSAQPLAPTTVAPEGHPKPDAARKLTITPIVLMAPRSDGIEAVWGISELCRGRLEWRMAGGAVGLGNTDAFGMVPQGTTVLRVRLSGLKPGQEYQVRAVTTAAVDGKLETSEWKTFRTLDPTSENSRFVVWNDTHLNNATIQQLHEKTPAADFLIWNGDICNDWTKEETLLPAMLNAGERDISQGRPLLLVWGNHDVRGKWAYRLPEMVATPNDRPFYAFRSGPIAVVCLHSGEDKPDDHPSFGGRVALDALRDEQTAWLKSVLAQPEMATAPYRLVFCHIPLRWAVEKVPDYAQGGYDWFSLRCRRAWHDLLVQWKTQAIISGHTHEAAVLPANSDFPYAQVVGGGPKPKEATWMEGVAEKRGFTLRVVSLEGEELHRLELGPISA
jgi:predicted phosphodiesterase